MTARGDSSVPAVVGLLALVMGCGAPAEPRKPLEMMPIGTVPMVPRTVEEPDGGETTSPNSATSPASKEAPCTEGDLDDASLQACETPAPPRAELPTGLKDKLEVRVTASTSTTTPGGRIDLTVALRNRASDALAVFMTGVSSPRFEVETYDAKGKRADLPAGKPPKGSSGGRDLKTWRITLSPGGTARLRTIWDAVKTRWVVDKAKAWEGRGPARAPGGPLPAGRYSLRVVLPLVTAEKTDLDVPKVSVDVRP